MLMQRLHHKKRPFPDSRPGSSLLCLLMCSTPVPWHRRPIAVSALHNTPRAGEDYTRTSILQTSSLILSIS